MKKKLLTATAFVLAAVLIAVIAADFLFSKNTLDSFIAMNTTVSLNITGLHCEDASAQIKREVTRLDSDVLSRTVKSSGIYALNSGNTSADDELAGLLSQMKALEKDSAGAFCVGLGRLTDLWAIGTDGARVPEESEISSALRAADSWTVNGNSVSIPDGVTLDMGAVGKGIACDYAADIIRQNNCSEAIVAVGGSILLYSSDSSQTFKVGIRDPLGEANEHCAVLETHSGFVSTSGNYERVFEDGNGKRYHHIFNPATGYPAESGLISVTVIADSGLVSDSLSTACFVLGIEKSLPLLEKYGAHAVFITADNKIITTFDDYSSLSITNEIFTFGEAK